MMRSILILFLILFLSCKEDKSSGCDSGLTVDVDLSEFDHSTWIKDVSLKKFSFKSISENVTKVIRIEEGYFVYDRVKENIFKFDIDGAFITSYHEMNEDFERGGWIVDIDYCEDSSEFVLLDSGDRFLRFADMGLELKDKTITTPSVPREVISEEGSRFLLSYGNEYDPEVGHALISLSQDGDYTGLVKADSLTHKFRFRPISCFSKSTTSTTFLRLLENTFHTFAKGDHDCVSLSFGGHTFKVDDVKGKTFKQL